MADRFAGTKTVSLGLESVGVWLITTMYSRDRVWLPATTGGARVVVAVLLDERASVSPET